MRKLYLKNDEKKTIYYLVFICSDYAILESIDGDIIITSDIKQIKMLDLLNREENKETEKIDNRDFLLQKSIFMNLVSNYGNFDLDSIDALYNQASIIKESFLKKYKENG